MLKSYQKCITCWSQPLNSKHLVTFLCPVLHFGTLVIILCVYRSLAFCPSRNADTLFVLSVSSMLREEDHGWCFVLLYKDNLVAYFLYPDMVRRWALRQYSYSPSLEFNLQHCNTPFLLPNTYLVFLRQNPCYVAQAGLELEVIWPQLSKCWDYRCEPAYPTKRIVSKHENVGADTVSQTAKLVCYFFLTILLTPCYLKNILKKHLFGIAVDS